ncbi:hypothetical protein BsWGS_02706 [Bradybaena similaris]
MAPLCNLCNKQQIVIEFLIVEKETFVNIHKHLGTVCGSCAVDRNIFRCWPLRIMASASREIELLALPHSGHFATATRPDILNRAVICSDRLITSQQLASQPSVSKGNQSAREISQQGKSVSKMKCH